jgi:uncharacterized YigZ family protein
VYSTILGESQHGFVVKNSEFLAFAAPCASLEAALTYLEGMKKRFADASHVCWAYKIGAQYRFSDDGEPSGTAGSPIFRALEMSGLNCIVVVVVRYYGGTNLGVGGLTRAYGGAAAEVLRIADVLEVHPRSQVKFSVPFEFSSVLYRLLESFGLVERIDAFSEFGLEVVAAVLISDVPSLELLLRDSTRGQGKLEVLD